jgi:hypothetical protein
MTKEEARRAILSEWRSWVKAQNLKNPTGTDGHIFYRFLRRERDDLLSFKAKGDKWQVLHGWLLRAGFVSD